MICPLFVRRVRRISSLLACVSLGLLVAHPAGQNASGSLTLLSKEGRRAVPIALVGDQEFVALDELAAIFQLAVQEDALGAITVSYKGRTIVLTGAQALASVSGRLVSLPAVPTRSGRRWLVPVEFVSRALAPIYDAKLDLRKPSHLLVVGDLRVPRVAIRFELAGTGARLTIDATPRATPTVSQENDRLLIKFDADALDLALAPIQGQGLVLGVRQADTTTLAVDLGPRFGAFRASTQPMDPALRLTIDIVATQTEVAAVPSTAPMPAPPPPDLSALTPPPSSVRTIAIDPGHGGDDAGVNGPGGTKEKDVTLAVARRLKAAIEGRLGLRVLLTRDDDRNIPADDRTATANNNKADLFVSLHANASLRPGTTGASILIAAFDKESEQAAGAARGGERLPTFSGGLREIELLPWGLAQLRHVERSGVLAQIVEQQFKDRVPLSAHPVDRGPLRILEAANMPAIVVEMGYLSNADQEKQLTGNEFQTAFVQAMVDAVVRFRDQLDSERPATSGPSALNKDQIPEVLDQPRRATSATGDR